jgi:hypothetical protein
MCEKMPTVVILHEHATISLQDRTITYIVSYPSGILQDNVNTQALCGQIWIVEQFRAHFIPLQSPTIKKLKLVLNNSSINLQLYFIYRQFYLTEHAYEIIYMTIYIYIYI